MNNHFELSDADFEQEFANCSFNPSTFSHEAHLRLSWIHIKKYGTVKAIENITNQLKKYVEFLGATDKYNETVTVAGIKIVNHFMKTSTATNFVDFIEQNEQLISNFKRLLSAHYTTNIFESKEAKRKYISPELIPFD